MTQDIDTTRVLPELEAVEACGLSPLAALALLVVPLLCAAFAAWGLWTYRAYIRPAEVARLAAIPLVSLYALFRILTDYHHYRTTADGLLAQGLIRKRLVRWTDVKEASIQKRQSAYPRLILRMAKGSFRPPLPTAGGRSSMDALIASVYQHLQRLGRADGLELTPSMLTLWQEIPEEIPVELEWGRPVTLPAKLGVLLLVIACCAFPIPFWWHIRWTLASILPAVFLTLAVPSMLVGCALPELLRKVHRASVTRDGLQADLMLQKVYVPWSSIQRSFWFAGQAPLLCLRAANTQIDIPYHLGSLESEHLILAVIRQLRESGVPQAITWPILVSRDPDYLLRPTLNSGRQGAMIRAYLYSLSPPARERLGLLYGMEIVSVLLGLVLFGVLMFAGVMKRLTAHLHAAGHTGIRYFIPASPLSMGFFLLFTGIVVPCVMVYVIAGWFAGPYKAEWKELNKIGSSKVSNILGTVVVTIGVLGVLSIPLLTGCYMKVTDRGIAVNRLLEFRERSYAWKDISEMVVHVRRPRQHAHKNADLIYVIRFSDGTCWKMDEGNYSAPSAPPIRQAGGFIIAKSGRKPLYR